MRSTYEQLPPAAYHEASIKERGHLSKRCKASTIPHMTLHDYMLYGSGSLQADSKIGHIAELCQGNRKANLLVFCIMSYDASALESCWSAN